MTKTDERVAATQVTWCLTHNGYATDNHGCGDPDHDHYDVVLDQHGQKFFRVWPVGTTWRTAEGYTMRLRKYDSDFGDMIAAEDRGDDAKAVPHRPIWDGVSPSGGAFSDGKWLPGPGDVIVEYVLADGIRPAPGALFVRPNGEAWRLRSYGTDWNEEPFTGNDTKPSWSLHLPKGASSNDDVLPSDARLVWHP